MTESTPLKSGSAERILVFSGPSGSGKSTVVDRILQQSHVPVLESVSATTRPRRVKEMHGKDYYFLTDEEFRQHLEAGDFLETAQVHKAGYWYGTLKSELERIRQANAWALLEIDVEGALKVLQFHPGALTIFLTTPSLEELERRLRSRQTESEDHIQRRLKNALEELKYADRYQHLVVNDEQDRAAREICDILVQREAELNA